SVFYPPQPSTKDEPASESDHHNASPQNLQPNPETRPYYSLTKKQRFSARKEAGIAKIRPGPRRSQKPDTPLPFLVEFPATITTPPISRKKRKALAALTPTPSPSPSPSPSLAPSSQSKKTYQKKRTGDRPVQDGFLDRKAFHRIHPPPPPEKLWNNRKRQKT
ncbi:hypothetical protein HK097_009333, partial [Rhizophlyctis rosea]